MAKTEIKKPSITEKTTPASKEGFVFSKINFQLFIASVVTIVIGYALMAGGKSNDPNHFSEDIFNFQRITLAPIVILAGYSLGIYAILKKSDSAE
jgi:Na+/H+-dicarboxylate symporter